MSGAEKIKDRILADARKSRDSILSDATREAQDIIENAEKEAFQKVTIITEKAREEAIQLKQRFRADEGMEDRKNELKARQDIIEEAFGTALARMANLPEDQYSLFLEGMILDTVKNGEGLISFNERDKVRLGDKFVSEMNNKIKAKANDAALVLSNEVLNSSGGFVLRYGDMEINCTFEVMLNMARPGLESEVASILFGGK
jgi:V/A-type H+-transporting ATPase subunit E